MSNRAKPGDRRRWLLGGLLVLLTLAAYSRALPAGFIWDDDDYVTENVTLRSAEGLRRIWLQPGAVPQYYPMVHTTFWIEYRLWGLDPTGFHVVNVLLHALAALLWWRLLAALGLPGAWSAWLAAALFALHPVHVESVAWITERKNVLSGVFYLLAFVTYLRAAPVEDDADRPASWKLWLLSLVLFLAALLSKTVTATLPAAIALVYWWKGRLRPGRFLPLVPFVVLGAGLGFFTVWMEKSVVGAQGASWDLSVAERLLLAGRAVWFYAAKLAWPHPLSFIYPRWELDVGAVWQWLFPIAALAVAVALWRLAPRIGRGPLVGVLYFAGTLVPALGFFDVFPFRYSWVADHFQYLASMGLLAIFAAALGWVGDRRAPRWPPVTALAAMMLAILGLLTWRQCRIYDDLETLWLATIRSNPESWMAHNNLGNLYESRSKAAGATDTDRLLAQAAEHYTRAVEIAERTGQSAGETYNNYANVLESRGETERAIEFYLRSIEQRPDNVAFRRNLGLALTKLNRLDEAEAALREAIRLQPKAAEPHGDLAVVLSRLGRAEEAAEAFAVSLELDPSEARTWRNAGIHYARTGAAEEAMRHLRRALVLDPDHAQTHQGLGALLGNQGALEEATEHLEIAVRLAPDDASARFNLANALARQDRFAEAGREFAEAERLARAQGRGRLVTLIEARRAELP